MSRSYAMTLPPISPDASGPICHLGASYLCPPCDAPAQVLLWTSALYAIWKVRSIGDMPHSSSTITAWWPRTTCLVLSEQLRPPWIEEPVQRHDMVLGARRLLG